jgi:gas vesicle protein
MKAKNFLLGVTAGVVGGMAVAAFIAPQSGNDLRTTLKSNTAVHFLIFQKRPCFMMS